ncbi:MAG: redoxin domain-containing protein [Pseudomonadota bacterium]
MELEALQGIVTDIKKLGASLIAISPQLEEYSKEVTKKHNLTYPVLSDTNNRIASLFKLTFGLPEDLRGLYNKFGIDLQKFNGNNDWQLPMPARFIINSQGKIIDSVVNSDYTKRPEPEKIIEILKNL